MPGWRSRNRLAADWFAKLRQNEVTDTVEHEDVKAVETTVDDSIANIDMSTKADVTYVDTALANIDMSTKADISYVDNALANVGGGKVLQVVQAKKQNGWSTNNTGFTNVMGVSITPKSTTSKFLVTGFISVSVGNNDDWKGIYLRVTENGSAMTCSTEGGAMYSRKYIGGGFARERQHGTEHFVVNELRNNKGNLNPITYYWQTHKNGYGSWGGQTVYINRSAQNSTSYSGNGITVLTVMEIEQ